MTPPPRKKPGKTPRKSEAARSSSTRPKSAAAQRAKPNSERSPQYVPPPYDASAVGRVALRVEILTVELVAAHFERRDSEPVPRTQREEAIPKINIDVQHKVTSDGALIGCLLTFGTSFDGRPTPYTLSASFRVLYSVTPGERLKRADVKVFAHYNAVFNVWPYWREYLSSTVNRAQLPRFVLPVFRVPRVSRDE